MKLTSEAYNDLSEDVVNELDDEVIRRSLTVSQINERLEELQKNWGELDENKEDTRDVPRAGGPKAPT